MSYLDSLPPDRAARARQVFQTNSAHRAVNDPVRLARAARIVRAALARKRLRLADLTPLPAEAEQDHGPDAA